jgi:hypothetical protein
MTKEKVQNKVDNPMAKEKEQTIWIVYFILYFFFGHWIVCTLFCTFSLAIGLFVLFLWPLDCLLYFVQIKYRRSNDQIKRTK